MSKPDKHGMIHPQDLKILAELSEEAGLTTHTLTLHLHGGVNMRKNSDNSLRRWIPRSPWHGAEPLREPPQFRKLVRTARRPVEALPATPQRRSPLRRARRTSLPA